MPKKEFNKPINEQPKEAMPLLELFLSTPHLNFMSCYLKLITKLKKPLNFIFSTISASTFKNIVTFGRVSTQLI